MKMTSVLVLATGLATGIASAADITGTVTLSGNPPAEKTIQPLKDDATCGKLHAETPLTRFYVVGPNKELADTIVMLKGVTGKSTGTSQKPAVLDQKGCLYVPQILAIQTGQKLLVKNSDPTLHNVHTTPTATGNKEENNAQMAGGPDLTFTFNAPENFLKFKCDVHQWMFAWVTVVDSPYYAVTGKDGKFTIKDVPPGKYTITALHRKGAPTGVDKEIEVKDGANTADFTIEVK
ncbi:MAG TPA: carboxypeptidase regulatory-like domain-containing protein [Candidatus Paceibacterota bacterium]|nr:carboxypeptidase regulatory-like domain-containing protein [Candidatus Paceibacterota bacterium]